MDLDTAGYQYGIGRSWGGSGRREVCISVIRVGFVCMYMLRGTVPYCAVDLSGLAHVDLDALVERLSDSNKKPV